MADLRDTEIGSNPPTSTLPDRPMPDEKDGPAPATSTQDGRPNGPMIQGHEASRRNKCTRVQFRVLGIDGKEKDIPEKKLQRDAPNLVYEYWDDKGGRSQCLGIDDNAATFEGFEILDEDAGEEETVYKVHWVGYRPDEENTTWLPKSYVRKSLSSTLLSRWRQSQREMSQGNGE